MRAYSHGRVPDAASLPRGDRGFIEWAASDEDLVLARARDLADSEIGEVQALPSPSAGVTRPRLAFVTLPGPQTLGLAPNRQQATDLSVPAGLGRSIALTRLYNSFFDPRGEFGRGWTLDHPQLLTTPVPVSRDGTRSQYRMVPHLISSLGSVDVQFNSLDRVEPYGAELWVGRTRDDIAGVGRGHSQATGLDTDQVLFRDGRVWHFVESQLVLQEGEAGSTRYVRDSNGVFDRSWDTWVGMPWPASHWSTMPKAELSRRPQSRRQGWRA